ncbi:MAG: uncharacterized protein JWO22_2830 [Frankiales bacterium]|nr:uncharacterized protein [Frankiales bacterium]
MRTARRSVSALLSLAHQGLEEAGETRSPSSRYALAHLAALRAAAAVLSCRTSSSGPESRTRPTSAWVLLAKVAPELTEWAQFFAAGAEKRAAAEAGIAGVVTPREADDLLRDAEAFVSVVETTLLARAG